MESMNNNVRRMLLVLAHPDDESFGMAGTIARYVAVGVEVSLICTTNGDVGSVASKFMQGFSSIAELRLAELRCAADTLRMKSVVTLGYRDSGMAGTADNNHPDSLFSADHDSVVGKIVKVIRELQPQVVVTFDPYGGYGHPDHIVTHTATVEAFHAAGDRSRYAAQLKAGLQAYQSQKLYFGTFDRRWLKLTLRLAPLFFINPRRMGRNHDVDGYEIASHSYPIHATINTGGYQEIANRARMCHASQLGGIGPRRMSEMVSRMVFGIQEHYMRGYPVPNGKIKERDLFEGVKGD
jgi:LmbE family N-acetylglucosaminyl deacetylase